MTRGVGRCSNQSMRRCKRKGALFERQERREGQRPIRQQLKNQQAMAGKWESDGCHSTLRWEEGQNRGKKDVRMDGRK